MRALSEVLRARQIPKDRPFEFGSMSLPRICCAAQKQVSQDWLDEEPVPDIMAMKVLLRGETSATRRFTEDRPKAGNP